MVANNCFGPSHFNSLIFYSENVKTQHILDGGQIAKYSDFQNNQMLVIIMGELNMGYFEQLPANQKFP